MVGEELVPCDKIGKKREDKESFSPVLRKAIGVRLIILIQRIIIWGLEGLWSFQEMNGWAGQWGVVRRSGPEMAL